METDYVSEAFGAQGWLAARFAGYEGRPSQIKVARAIHEAVVLGRHGLVEAPPGTGKAAALAVVALYQAAVRDAKVLVVTSTNALAEQLQEELLRLREVLPWKPEIAVLKGLGNYACEQQVARSVKRGLHKGLYTRELRQQADEVLRWFEDTPRGDMAELPFVPHSEVWSRFAVEPAECKGESCPAYRQCFGKQARAAAQKAGITVTNVSLFCAHLAVRKETGASDVLPAYDYVFLDEGHELSDRVRDTLGFTLHEGGLRQLGTLLEELGLRAQAKALVRAGVAFLRQLSERCALDGGGRRIRAPLEGLHKPLAAALNEARLAVSELEETEEWEADDELRAGARMLTKRLELFAARLAEAASLADPQKVYFIEAEGEGTARLCARGVDVAEFLRSELFERVRSVVLVSATLATSGDFEFTRHELGIPQGSCELSVGSPFDFEAQALLVIPEGLTSPKEASFSESVGPILSRVIELCRGRTLGLFTSHRGMKLAHAHVAHCGYRVLCQGECSSNELRRTFKEDVASVLLGTGTFWTGIDVPGEALSAVVIDRIPFPRADDPVIEALCARQVQPFEKVILPRAIIKLRQGVGRLIRSRSDTGVVVLLDRRIADSRYGSLILDSLPPMRTTRRLDHIARFLSDAEHAQVA